MPDMTRPLRFTSEVEHAVLDAGLYDMQMAHGAGLVAERSQFELLAESEVIDGSFRGIRGVTAVSLDRAGDITYRTATFGTTYEAGIAQVEGLGTNAVIGLGVPTDKSPRVQKIANIKLGRQGFYEKLNDRGRCTLGGALVVEGEEAGTLMTLPFVSSSVFNFFLKSSSTRLSGVGSFAYRLRSGDARQRKQAFEDGTGPDPRRLAALGSYAFVISQAIKRPGGPVVVERPFIASV